MDEAGDIEIFRELAFNLSDMMVLHIDDEESYFPEVLEKSFTHQEYAKILQIIIQGRGFANGFGNRVNLPWIIDAMYGWAGTEATNEFYKG